jgi:hypothetical protein
MAEDLEMTRQALRKIASRMFLKLGARSMPHAVYLACASGVLAVDPPRPKGAEVLAQPSLRLLRSLMAEGFSLVFIAERMGMGQPELSVLMQRQQMTPEMAARVRRVFADLAGRDPLELGVHPRGRTRALNRARAEGWEIVSDEELALLLRTVLHAA